MIPETRNLRRFLVSGISGKNGAMGFFSDHSVRMKFLIYRLPLLKLTLREIQPATAGAQLSQVEEDVDTENANTTAAFRESIYAQ